MELCKITFGTIMTTDPRATKGYDGMNDSRAVKAYDAMKDLGISKEEVKPVLRNLLKVYDKNWELIEDDNYRTLIDAYFESKEDKVS